MHPELNSQLAKNRVDDLRRSAPARPTSARRRTSLPAAIERLRTARAR